jgi:hypothetical protein
VGGEFALVELAQGGDGAEIHPEQADIDGG